MGLVLLFGSPSVCIADEAYDRQLESAVMKIVAGKMGDIRGPLDREWTPAAPSPEAPEGPSAASQQPQKPPSTGSFVAIDPPAVAHLATDAAASLVIRTREVFEPTPKPEPKRRVRIIPLYH